jgi:hypothetical protein
MREKRKHMRIPISHPVLCEAGAREPFAAVITDLGIGGARIESTHTPTYAAEIVLSLRLPGAAEMSRLPAIVRWTRPGAFGVQFGLLGARDTKAIVELMAEALRRD